MNPLKLAYIGGGSAYAAGVVRSFAAAALRARDAFADGEIALMDLDAGNLETVGQLPAALSDVVGHEPGRQPIHALVAEALGPSPLSRDA